MNARMVALALSAALHGVHDAAFVEFLRSAHAQWLADGREGFMLPGAFPARGLRRECVPDGIHGRLGYYAFDAGTPIVEGTWEAAPALAKASPATSPCRAALAGTVTGPRWTARWTR